MKHSAADGCAQHDTVQAAVAQGSRLLVGHARSNPPRDQGGAVPTVEARPPAVGTPTAAALDAGCWSAATIAALARRGSAPYRASGREPQQQSGQAACAARPAPPPAAARPTEQLAYTRKTAAGQAISRLRKCPVEPVLGLINEPLGFRQCSLRGLAAAAGAWGWGVWPTS
jgi:hypothetical protein